MKAKDVYDLVLSGSTPIIEMTETEECEGADKGMRMRIISAALLDTNTMYPYYLFHCDLKEFEEYNLPFELPEWFDKNGNMTLRWRETSSYPKDGMHDLFLSTRDEENTLFKIIDLNPIYERYKESQSDLSYINWLEKEVERLS